MSTETIVHHGKHFLKAFKKLQKPIQIKATKRIELFLQSPTHPSLNIHKLSGKLQGRLSFNVTGDYRVWFREKKDKQKREITFLHIGTHSQLYG